jgi:hypothetical protein
MGTAIPKIRLLTPPVGEHLNLLDHVITGFLTRQIRALRRTLTLHAAAKPLRYRMVSTLPLSSHPARDTMLRQTPPGGMAGVLSTTVPMGHQPHIGLATTERHRPGGRNPLLIPRIPQRPPHSPACLHLSQSRQLHPACLGPQRGESTAPRHMGRRHLTVALKPMRRHPIPMAALGGLGTTAAAPRDRPPACCSKRRPWKRPPGNPSSWRWLVMRRLPSR